MLLFFFGDVVDFRDDSALSNFIEGPATYRL